MDEKAACACGAATRLVFACSGAADVGGITHQAARKMTRDGTGKMYCLAGIGGRIPDIMETTKAASAILAIDGCPLDCARRTLEEGGFSEFSHLRLYDLGMEKGKAALSAENVDIVAAKGADLLQAAKP